MMADGTCVLFVGSCLCLCLCILSVVQSKVDHPFPLKRGRHEAHRLRVVCGSFPNPRCVIRCLISWASCLASWEGCAGDFIEARSSLLFHYLVVCVGVGMQVVLSWPSAMRQTASFPSWLQSQCRRFGRGKGREEEGASLSLAHVPVHAHAQWPTLCRTC